MKLQTADLTAAAGALLTAGTTVTAAVLQYCTYFTADSLLDPTGGETWLLSGKKLLSPTCLTEFLMSNHVGTFI